MELTADAAQLESEINKTYDAIHSLNATVDFRASVGGEKRGKVTDYNVSIRGFILLRKPEMLRVLGLVPVLHTPAFDMASDGKTFKLLIPPKNKAIVGSNADHATQQRGAGAQHSIGERNSLGNSGRPRGV